MVAALLFGVLVGVLVVTPAAWGQSAGVMDPVNGLSAEDLVLRALPRNGDLLAAQQQVAAARGSLTQAGLRANPSLELSGMQEVAGSDNNFMVGGTVPLELFGRRERRVEVARADVLTSQFEAAQRERQLRLDIELKVGDVLAALRNLQFTEELAALNRHAVELVRARVEKGSGTPLEWNMQRVELSRILATQADLEGKLGVNLLELKSLVAMKPEEPLQVKGTLEPEPFPLTLEAATSRALQKRPDLLAMRASETAAAAKLKQARVEARPDASLNANYQRMDFGFGVNGILPGGGLRRVQGIFNEVTVGVSLALPVRNRNQGAIESAVALREAAHRRREYAELIVEREVAAVFLSHQKARQGLDIYREGVREQARQNLDVVRKVYELGRTNYMDVIAEQRRYVDVETGYTEALQRYYQASVRLCAAVAGDGRDTCRDQ
jgi:outer membrane protein, heavy metal efflux system